MKLLTTSIHRMTLLPKGGIRWSSYVGDIICYYNRGKNGFRCINGSHQSHARYLHINSTSTQKSKHYSGGNAPHERLLVLGSGVAGCATALTAARHGIPVTILHAGRHKEDCNSYWAQGGVIYRNYRLMDSKATSPSDEPQLVDTPLSLVNDIRIASGYTPSLKRTDSLEECIYSSHLLQNNINSSKMGQVCPTSGVHWNEDAAWKLACEGPTRVRQLLLGSKDDGLGDSLGCVVPFDRTNLPTGCEDDDNDALSEKDGSEDDVLSLCLEASHAAPRIIHHADCTGKAITISITKAASEHPLIDFVGDAVVTDLIIDENFSESSISGVGSCEIYDKAMVIGARVLNKQTNQIYSCYAVHGVVLASGGLASIYEHSTNPSGFNALGSSVGLALRLENHVASNTNSIVSDLEYVQFHPTSLYLPNEARFLLTEALRGEGAILRDMDGRAFAHDYHPNGELAPRDIVARAVFSESQKTAENGERNAYLDITHRDSTWLKTRFPSIHAHLMSREVPMNFTKEKIPVIPAAHYTCGGVTTNLNGCVVGSGGGWYRNLYAAGEAARTGLHGGNRLASTSLLEGLVFGASIGEMVAGVIGDGKDGMALERREKVVETMHQARHSIEHRLALEQSSSHGRYGLSCHNGSNNMRRSAADYKVAQKAVAILTHLKSVMWDNVGVVRTPTKLALAVSELKAIRDQAERLWKKDGAGWEVVALRDAAHAGLAVADAALANQVSGGAHYIVLEEDEDQMLDVAEDDDLIAARA